MTKPISEQVVEYLRNLTDADITAIGNKAMRDPHSCTPSEIRKLAALALARLTRIPRTRRP